MPIVTEDSQPKRRRAPWWVLAVALVGLLPVGVVAWSLFQPVKVTIGSKQVTSSEA